MALRCEDGRRREFTTPFGCRQGQMPVRSLCPRMVCTVDVRPEWSPLTNRRRRNRPLWHGCRRPPQPNILRVKKTKDDYRPTPPIHACGWVWGGVRPKKNVCLPSAALFLTRSWAAAPPPADAKTSKGKQQYLQIKLQDATISSARTKQASTPS